MRLDKKYVLILFVLMLSVSFVSGVGTAQSSENISDGERYWVGQNLTYEVENGSSNAELVKGENNTFVTELDINNSMINVNTSSYTEDLYTLSYDNANNTENSVNFNLTQQNISVSPSENEVTNSSNTSINFNYESNRNDYNISVSGENVSDEDLASLYGVNESEVTDGEVIVNSGQSIDLNFTDFDAGTYNFTFNVTDTTAKDSSNVNVTETGDSNVEISESRVTTAEGDEAEFTLEFENTNQSTVVIGNESELGYEIEFDVEKQDDNDSVVLIFNTYHAGVNNQSDVISVHDDSDANVTVNNETVIDNQRLAPANYDISVLVNDQETDIGEIEVTERSTDDVSVHAIPNGTEVSEAEDIESNTSTSEVAQNDLVALQVEMSGVYGYLDDGYDLNNDLNGLYLDISEDSPNSGSSINISNSNLYTQPDENMFYVIFESNNSNINLDTNYNVEVGLNNESGYIDSEDEEESVTTSFRTVERNTEFVTNQNDTVEVTESNMNVVANTNIANGSETELVVRNTDDPDIDEYDAVVENSQFDVNISDSNISQGDNFTVQLRGESSEVDALFIESEDENNDTDDTNSTDNTTNNSTEDNLNDTENTTDEGTDEEDSGLIASIINFFRGLLGL